MEIYDNGYLTEEEKEAIDVQDLIYMAISNYTGNPVEKILPRFVYKYELQEDGKIQRTRYCSAVQGTESDVPWETFVNTREPDNPYHRLFFKYYKVDCLDDNGIVCDAANETSGDFIPLDFAGRNTPYRHIRPIEKNTAYFLRWVDDTEFMDTLKKFA